MKITGIHSLFTAEKMKEDSNNRNFNEFENKCSVVHVYQRKE